MRKLKVAIIGAGELGIQASHYMKLMSSNDIQYVPVCWLDDTYETNHIVNEIKVIGKPDDVYELYRSGKFDACFIAIGYNHLDFKLGLIKKYKGLVPMINILSTNSYVDKTAEIGDNVFIYPGVIVDKRVKLNDGCLLNLGSIVSHDSEIGECSFLAPNTTVAGFSKIGKCSFLGISSGIIDNISICDNVRIGAGAMVTKDILSPGVYCGVPARIIKPI